MAELEVKQKPTRYPMKTHKQARNTLHRLTLDLLHGKIDVQVYRAACYGISVQCSLFKLEVPEHKELDIKIAAPDWVTEMSPEEREKKLDEFAADHLAWKKVKEEAAERVDRFNEEFLKRRATNFESPGGERVQVTRPDFIVEGEMETEAGISKQIIIDEVEGKEKPDPISQPEKQPEKGKKKIQLFGG